MLSMASVLAESRLPAELQARILGARARAALQVGDLEAADSHFREALRLSPGTLGPEPLFRLQLVRQDLEGAKKTLAEFDDSSPLKELLLAVLEAQTSGTGASEDLLKLQTNTPEGLLYSGLLLDSSGRHEVARARLLEFLKSGEWGKELAVAVLLREGAPKCEMCRKTTASTFEGQSPVCSTCHHLLTDPEWLGRLMFEPDPESVRLMKNLHGENYLDLKEMIQGLQLDYMADPAPFTPEVGLAELMKQMNPEVRSLWSRAQALAQERGRSRVGTGELGVALFEGDFDDRFFSEPEAQDEALREAQIRPEESGNLAEASEEVIWVLNVARWFSLLSPHHPERDMNRNDLAMALDLSRPRPGIRASAGTSLIAFKMSEEQLDLFEALSQNRPDSLFLHLVLSELRVSRYRDADRQRRLEHELWLIEHHPELFRSSSSYPEIDNGAYRAVVEAWAKILESRAEKAVVLERAASFFTNDEKALALALLERCQELEPQKRTWSRQMSQVMSLMQDNASSPEEKQEWAREELETIETALAASNSPAERGPLLTSLVMAAFDAGAHKRAREVAQLLLESSNEQDWNSGNAHHKAHTVLGLLALEGGDQESAKKHLLDSARTEGSPQLNSFGPNMRLAKALLLLGEIEMVLSYLELCEAFWKSPDLAA